MRDVSMILRRASGASLIDGRPLAEVPAAEALLVATLLELTAHEIRELHAETWRRTHLQEGSA